MKMNNQGSSGMVEVMVYTPSRMQGSSMLSKAMNTVMDIAMLSAISIGILYLCNMARLAVINYITLLPKRIANAASSFFNTPNFNTPNSTFHLGVSFPGVGNFFKSLMKYAMLALAVATLIYIVKNNYNQIMQKLNSFIASSLGKTISYGKSINNYFLSGWNRIKMGFNNIYHKAFRSIWNKSDNNVELTAATPIRVQNSRSTFSIFETLTLNATTELNTLTQALIAINKTIKDITLAIGEIEKIKQRNSELENENIIIQLKSELCYEKEAHKRLILEEKIDRLQKEHEVETANVKAEAEKVVCEIEIKLAEVQQRLLKTQNDNQRLTCNLENEKKLKAGLEMQAQESGNEIKNLQAKIKKLKERNNAFSIVPPFFPANHALAPALGVVNNPEERYGYGAQI